MNECAQKIIGRETFWAQWKDNSKGKCYNFERPSYLPLKEKMNSIKKRDLKVDKKNQIAGLSFNQAKNGKTLNKILSKPKDFLD